MVYIEYAELKGVYKILWLRYIYGVDLSQHCMKCLLGHNDKRVRGYMRTLRGLKLEESRYYYLCGVDEYWRWNKNLHLAFIPSYGSVIEIDNEFIKCKIHNAKQLPITPDYIDWSLPQAKNKLFHTCRNWQFANMLARWSSVSRAPVQKSLFD